MRRLSRAQLITLADYSTEDIGVNKSHKVDIPETNAHVIIWKIIAMVLCANVESSFTKCRVVANYDSLRFSSRRVPAGRNNNARRRWNDSENEPVVPKPAPPSSLYPQRALHRHYHEWRCRRTSFYLPTRPVRFCIRARPRVCVRGRSKKRISHLYRLAPYRSEVYLAVDWHENPVEAFIMGGAVRLGEEKKMSIHPAA